MNSKIFKNLMFYGAYQILLPLMSLFAQNHITTVFEPAQLGLYALTNTVTMYFILYAGFELNKYGVKIISGKQKDIQKLSTAFNKVYKVQFINGLIALIAYLMFVTFIAPSEYKMLYYIQALFILATMFDIFWFYAGIEKMGIISIRNIIIQFFSVSLIVLTLKNPSQLLNYAFIMSAMPLIGNISMWLGLKKRILKIDFYKYKISEVSKYFKGASKLLIPHLIIYSIAAIDKLILGNVSSKSELGYYEKVIMNLSIIIVFMSSVGIVLMPMMNKLKQESSENYQSQTSFFITSMVIISSVVAMLIITQVDIFKLIYDQNNWDFTKVSRLFQLGSFLVILTATSQLIVNIIIIPCNMNRLITINSTITFIFALFTYYIGSKLGNSEGLIIAKIITELLYLTIFSYYIYKHYKINFQWKDIIKNTIIITILIITSLITKNFIEVPISTISLVLITVIKSSILVTVYVLIGYFMNITLIKYSIYQAAKLLKIKKG